MKKDKYSLKTISKASFNNKLKARDFENIDLINLNIILNEVIILPKTFQLPL